MSSEIVIKPVSSVRDLGVILDKNLTFHEHITKVSQACFFHIRDLRRIRPFLDLKTAATIGTALVQSKLDYCNSLFLNLPACEIQRLQFLQNSLARAVVRKSKYSHVTPLLKSLHWLRVNERILYKVLSLTYKAIETSKPTSLSDMIAVHETGVTRSAKLVTLKRPAIPSRCKLSNRTFRHAAPQIWNSLPSHLRNPNFSGRLALTREQFLKKIKTHLFGYSYPDTSHCELRPARKPPFQ